ncbi:AAA family ATPase, partial [Candidatus Parcubacteria bacterium]
MKKLPIGIANFERMIRNGYVYVDKTRWIYKMVSEGMFYFLSRPRRFGKTLLVSTLAHLFSGHRELFEGLWIAEAEWDWTAHPILKLDMSELEHQNADILRQALLQKLQGIGQQEGIALPPNLLRNAFSELIIGLARKYNQSVVVLIDEYDQPLISHLGKGEQELEIAKQNREVLRDFFGVLKGGNVNDVLEFVFLTGISKFSQVSIFSELNNLNDLTMHPQYGEILGYTQEEVERYFPEYIQRMAQTTNQTPQNVLNGLREWYNGYRFTRQEIQVYNPFSILKALDRQEFSVYWFETATPAFLVNLIKERNYPVVDLECLQIPESFFTTYDLERLQLEPLLFQTGYLTIQKYDGLLYELGYPNSEVKKSFTEFLYNELVPISDSSVKLQYNLLPKYLQKRDLKNFVQTVNSILSSIPYVHIQGQDEHYYHTVFYLMLTAGGISVHTEVLTSRGRMDMAVETGDTVYVIELKCNQSAAEALTQIKQRGYADRYRGS